VAVKVDGAWSGLVAVIVAPSTGLPVSSRTVPVILATDCAATAAAIKKGISSDRSSAWSRRFMTAKYNPTPK
jgi:hypothetical protein